MIGLVLSSLEICCIGFGLLRNFPLVFTCAFFFLVLFVFSIGIPLLPAWKDVRHFRWHGTRYWPDASSVFLPSLLSSQGVHRPKYWDYLACIQKSEEPQDRKTGIRIIAKTFKINNQKKRSPEFSSSSATTVLAPWPHLRKCIVCA